MTRYRCTECEQICTSGDILKATNPFNEDDRLSFCPNCKRAERLDLLCDVLDCENLSSCGWPSPEGYRLTCHDCADTLMAWRGIEA